MHFPGMRFRNIICVAGVLIALGGCTTVRMTSPARTSQELLLVSTAADRAADAMAAQVPANLSVFIDTSGFSAQDQSYSMAAITDALLRHGVKVVSGRDQADAIIMPRAGDLSTDERQRYIGLPSLPAPLPTGGILTLPSLSLYQENDHKGVAKFAATIYDPKTGKLIVSTEPAYGFSSANDGVILFFISWRKNDLGVDASRTPPRVAPN
jgi:hypothetical protein